MNTYDLEDVLFGYLRRQKRLETPIDIVAMTSLLAIFALGGIITISQKDLLICFLEHSAYCYV